MSRVAVAFVTVWILATLAMLVVFGFWGWAIVGSAVLAYLTVIGVPVYLAMNYLGKRSIVSYAVAALVAGLPISSLWIPDREWLAVAYFLAVAGVCGLVGHWIVERT